MSKKYLRLEEFTEQELKEQYNNGKIDLEFMFKYISTQDRVYNKLIDRANYLEKKEQDLIKWLEDKIKEYTPNLKLIGVMKKMVRNMNI